MPAQTVIKLRRGTAAQWTSANPVLAAGEMGIETDTNKSKYGDGTTAWSSLSYSVASASGSATVEWTDVLNKPSTFTPSSHTHPISQVTDLQAALDAKQPIVSGVTNTEIGYLDGVTSAIQTQLDGKAASVHTHAISDTTGLQTALDGKAASVHTHAISDTTGLQTALDSKLTATVSSPASGQVISYNGSSWVNSAAPSGGGMTLISDTTLSSGQSSVTLSNIPQTYKKLELEINFTGSVSAPSNATMTFNGQTSSNYGWGYPVFYAGTGTSTGTQNAIFLYGYNQGAGVILPSTTSGNTYVTIPGYTSTTHPKNFQFFSYLSYMSNTIHNGAGIWNHFQHSLNPITSIGFNFSAVGSAAYRIKLWGIN